LVVAPAELAVPALGGFEVCEFAEALGLGADVLLGDEYLGIDFGVEGELHLCVGGPSAALLAFAAVFLPAEEVPAGDAVLFGDFLGVDALQDLRGWGNTCLTASSFSATVYLR
jgi:hypothetical protein